MSSIAQRCFNIRRNVSAIMLGDGRMETHRDCNVRNGKASNAYDMSVSLNRLCFLIGGVGDEMRSRRVVSLSLRTKTVGQGLQPWVVAK